MRASPDTQSQPARPAPPTPPPMTEVVHSLCAAVITAPPDTHWANRPVFAAAVGGDPVEWHHLVSAERAVMDLAAGAKPWAVGVVAAGRATIDGQDQPTTSVLVVDAWGRCHATAIGSASVVSSGAPEGALVRDCIRLLAIVRQASRTASHAVADDLLAQWQTGAMQQARRE